MDQRALNPQSADTLYSYITPTSGVTAIFNGFQYRLPLFYAPDFQIIVVPGDNRFTIDIGKLTQIGREQDTALSIWD